MPTLALRDLHRDGQQLPCCVTSFGTSAEVPKHRWLVWSYFLVHAFDLAMAAAFVGHVFFLGAFNSLVENEKHLERPKIPPFNPVESNPGSGSWLHFCKYGVCSAFSGSSWMPLMPFLLGVLLNEIFFESSQAIAGPVHRY